MEVPAGSASRSCGLLSLPTLGTLTMRASIPQPARWYVSRRSPSGWTEG